MNYQNCLFTLPMNLRIRPSKNSGGGYGVWSVKDIPCKTMFGPYQGVFTDKAKTVKGGFQWKMETKGKEIMTLDGSEEKKSSWLRYVNYARNKEEQNLITVHCQSQVFYTTCKVIPANTQLFVWYQEKLVEKRSNQKKEISIENSLVERQNITNISVLQRNKQDRKKTDLPLQTTYSLIKTITPPLYLLMPYPLLFNTTMPHNGSSTIILNMPPPKSQENMMLAPREIQNNVMPVTSNSQTNKLFNTKTIASTISENTTVKKEKPYECKICHKRYTREDSLRDHVRDHTGERPYQCNICKKNFKTYSNFRSHIVTHSTEKPYRCEICQKYYKNTKVFKLHQLKHTGERPFECKVCNKRFFEKSYLNRHVRIHTGEKPYECNVCSKKFRVSDQLNVHRTIHTGEKRYECQICHRRFRVSSALRAHKRIHTGEKPYECKVCLKKFRFDSPFRTHMKIHAEKKSYQCEICCDTFRSTVKHCCKQLPIKCKMCNNEYIRYDDFLHHKSTHCKNSTVKVSTLVQSG